MKRIKKPTRLDHLASSVARDWAHQNSVVVHSRMRVLQFEGEEVDKSIVALAAALATAKERRKKIDAMLRGLAAVVEKR